MRKRKYLVLVMGYNIEISINMLKHTKFSEMESVIHDKALYYNCANIYVNSEEDGTNKIPRYHCIFVIHFLEEHFDNFLLFVKSIKNYKPIYIECIYVNHIFKLLYASVDYLKSIEKWQSNNYKQFIKDKQFTSNELKLLRELV